MEKLTKREWTLIGIALAEGKPLSPVQLQKSVFLLQQVLPGEVLPDEPYEFVPYSYGPFCADVYDDAKILVDGGLATAQKHARFDFQCYAATPEGMSEGQRLVESLPTNVTEQARRIVLWVREQTFKGLVSAIYEKYPAYRENSIFRG